MSKTLFEKIWDKHVVDTLPDGTIQLYIDRLYCHEVTSPQGFRRITCTWIEALPSRANHLYAGPQYPDIEPR